MTPVERYKYLVTFWKNQIVEAEDTLKTAQNNYEEWNNKLIKAEIAEKLASEK
jgi:hypothetical protein